MHRIGLSFFFLNIIFKKKRRKRKGERDEQKNRRKKVSRNGPLPWIPHAGILEATVHQLLLD